MFDRIKNHMIKEMKKEYTMKQNFWNFILYCYTPILMVIGYYVFPTGKEIVEKAIPYEILYIMLIILFFSFSISPLLNFIKQYRSSRIAR